ncbi:MAG TPA: response regulator [Candidatus Nanoarchaeia archaeon]|nr:response regulator [Candidatus Nanoarchaeia archaeon]
MQKIMIVDDEPSIRELIKAIFSSEGFEVIDAASGQECLEKLKTEKPDLILMDMMMPGMSGRETVEKIRQSESTKNLKIMFLTVARFSETGKETLDNLNVLDYVTKPFDNDDLVKKAKKALG